ncbi:MAG: type II secretion system F family protein [Rhodospirillales bacterium]|nr:type II secretion system F family protein [Rhodospirillales bacterium]
MTLAEVILFSGTAITLLLAVFGTVTVLGARRRMVHNRAQKLTLRLERGPIESSADHGELRRLDPKRFPVLEEMVRRILPNPDVLRTRLDRTGRRISIGGYVAGSLVIALVAVIVATAAAGLPLPTALLGGLAAGLIIPHWLVGRMAERRRNKFTNLFPDAIDLMVRGLKSGLPVSEGITSIGTEMIDPVGVEFRSISDSIRLGQSLDDALWATAKRLNTADFNFFVTTLNVQRETGGNLAETLSNLSEILRKRKQMKKKVKAMSSEARASAYILGSLPFLMLAILMVLNYDYAMALFRDPRGHTLVAIGVASLLTGVGIMFKMVKFEP